MEDNKKNHCFKVEKGYVKYIAADGKEKKALKGQKIEDCRNPKSLAWLLQEEIISEVK